MRATRAQWRRQLLTQLLALPGPELYARFLTETTRRGSAKAAGWAANLYREIRGDWPPRDCRQGAVQVDGDNDLVVDWMALRPKTPRIKRERPAPLLECITQKQTNVDDHGFTPDSLMRPEDWEASWK